MPPGRPAGTHNKIVLPFRVYPEIVEGVRVLNNHPEIMEKARELAKLLNKPDSEVIDLLLKEALERIEVK